MISAASRGQPDVAAELTGWRVLRVRPGTRRLDYTEWSLRRPGLASAAGQVVTGLASGQTRFRGGSRNVEPTRRRGKPRLQGTVGSLTSWRTALDRTLHYRSNQIGTIDPSVDLRRRVVTHQLGYFAATS